MCSPPQDGQDGSCFQAQHAAQEPTASQAEVSCIKQSTIKSHNAAAALQDSRPGGHARTRTSSWQLNNCQAMSARSSTCPNSIVAWAATAAGESCIQEVGHMTVACHKTTA